MTFLSNIMSSPSLKKLVSTQQQSGAQPTAAPTSTAPVSPMSIVQNLVAGQSNPLTGGPTSGAANLTIMPKIMGAVLKTSATTPNMAASNIGTNQTGAQKTAANTANQLNKAGGQDNNQNNQNSNNTLASDPTQYWNQANSAINQQEDTARQFGADQIAANQRRAATLSALSGRGLGEGFLSGQTQATISGINNTNQQINQLEAQRQQIYGTEAGQAFQQGQTQQNNAFNLNMQTAQNTAQANAQQLGSQKQTAAQNAEASLQASGINVAGMSGPAWNSFKNLIDAVNNAPDAASLQAAQQKLNRAMSNLQALRQQNPKAKGDDWDKLVKNAEKAGQFTNT